MHDLELNRNVQISEPKTDYLGRTYLIIAFGADSAGNVTPYMIDGKACKPKDITYYVESGRIYNPYPLMDDGEFLAEYIRGLFS